MKEYLNNLNDKQREAAMCTEGPLLILAGAGSGKTSTMTCRIAYLIDEKGVDPYNILAVTFTNKAAGEMRDRVEQLIGQSPNMWILTFHSACLRILRMHAEVLGYSRDFAVYDPTDQKALVRSISKDLQIDGKKFTPAYFLGRISKCKEERIGPSEYERIYGSDFREQMVAKVYTAYERELKKNNAMDFDDLLLNAVRLFEADEKVLLKYQRRFRYIMVDEYQDTNQIQYAFIRMLADAHNNICVVGDDDQCIYQWRGADIRNILEFEKDFRDARVVKLEQNYRSTGNILAAAHSVIENNASRKAKKLWTDAEDGNKITCCRTNDEKEEASYIASEIDRITGGAYGGTEGARYSDFAVLYRTNAQSRTFEEALSRRDIPYRVLGSLRYYDRKEIKDLMCYMRLVHNPSDDVALLRVINEPKRGIGGKTMEKLQALARVREETLFETLQDDEVMASLGPKAREGVREFVEMIKEISQQRENMRISDIYDALLVRSGYLKSLEDQRTIESEARIENIMEFKSVITGYEDDEPDLTLAEFMERIALLADVDQHDPDEDAVVLMTLHSAKGLEFPYVFMPGMEDGLFPGWRAYDSPDGLDEERRLCYVGITRAKKRLWMTSAESRMIYGKTDYTRESQFLRELDPHLVEGDPIRQKKRDLADGQFRDGVRETRPYKPFDQLKYARQMTRSNVAAMAGSANEKFEAGDMVEHPKFGKGEVLETDGKIVRVRFLDGEKKLALGMAPISKVQD